LVGISNGHYILPLSKKLLILEIDKVDHRKSRSNTVASSVLERTCVVESQRERQHSSYSQYSCHGGNSAYLQPPTSSHGHPTSKDHYYPQPKVGSQSAASNPTIQSGGYAFDSTTTLSNPFSNYSGYNTSQGDLVEPKSYSPEYGSLPSTPAVLPGDESNEFKINKLREICFIAVVACSHLMSEHCGPQNLNMY